MIYNKYNKYDIVKIINIIKNVLFSSSFIYFIIIYYFIIIKIFYILVFLHIDARINIIMFTTTEIPKNISRAFGIF